MKKQGPAGTSKAHGQSIDRSGIGVPGVYFHEIPQIPA